MALTDGDLRVARFFVPGTPASAGRPRFSRRGEKGVAVHMPTKNKLWASIVREAWEFSEAAEGWRKLERGTPIRLDAQFRFPRPAAHYGSGRNAAKLKPSAPRWHTSGNNRGDIDNLLKLLLDALLAADPPVWHDDGQVVQLGPHTEKLYVAERPGVLVEIRELREPRVAS